jgi:scyllo-inositol 2-dehydrogenase (NADP+)
MQKVRVGIVGGGWVTENRHLPALATHPNCELSVIVGQDESRIEKLKRRFHIPSSFIGDAAQDTSWLQWCDAVVIGTEPFSHYPLVKHCLEHGKHVLVEKPFTVSLEESKELVLLAQTKKLKLAVVHNFQFSASAKALEKDIYEHKIGTLRSLEAVQYSNPRRRLPSWYESLPWGLFFDESPHLLYLLEKFGEEIKLQSASAFRSREGKNTPDLVSALFTTRNNIPASLHLNFRASVSEWFLIVNGDKRVGILDIFRDTYFSLPNDGRHLPLDILRTSKEAFFGHMFGVLRSGIKVLRGSYLCGNEDVVDSFLRSIILDESLKEISGNHGVRINTLQFEIMNKASLF